MKTGGGGGQPGSDARFFLQEGWLIQHQSVCRAAVLDPVSIPASCPTICNNSPLLIHGYPSWVIVICVNSMHSLGGHLLGSGPDGLHVELGQFPQAKVLRRSDWGWAICNSNVVCCASDAVGRTDPPWVGTETWDSIKHADKDAWDCVFGFVLLLSLKSVGILPFGYFETKIR